LSTSGLGVANRGILKIIHLSIRIFAGSIFKSDVVKIARGAVAEHNGRFDEPCEMHAMLRQTVYLRAFVPQ
jgi:hypothetical protein